MSEAIKAGNNLTGEEEKILKVFESVIPNLTPIEKARLLGWGEGMAIRQEPERRTS